MEGQDDPEGGSGVLRAHVPVRRGLHRVVDHMRPQANVLVPRNQVLLRPRHLLRRERVRAGDGRTVRQARGADLRGVSPEQHQRQVLREITQQMLKNTAFPGSNNGTGLFQTLIGLKVREVYEKMTSKTVANVSA